jgi:hypothetical protein
MKSATLSLLMFAVLAVALPASLPPTVEAAPPRAVKTFSGSLTSANPSVTQPWQLSRDFPDPGFLFHYAITGGSQLDDVVYVYIEETGDAWDVNWPLMGEGWTYCSPTSFQPCPFSAGSYNVTVEAGPAASLPISYSIGFYLVPNPPVDFSGHFPANSDSRRSTFGVLLPSAATSEIVLGVTSGSYAFFVDNKNETLVNRNTQLSFNLTKGFHQLEVSSEEEGIGEDVAWSVQVSGPPKLDVRIVDTCPALNPESGQSICVTHAEATASSGTPAVSYQWAVSGGSLNSTGGQWVAWTAPPGVATYTLTVNASAPGYVSGTDSLIVQVAPEFPTGTLPFLGAVVLASSLLIIRLRFRHPASSRR